MSFLALACFASQLNAATYRDAHNYFPHLPKNTIRINDYVRLKNTTSLNAYKRALHILFDRIKNTFQKKSKKDNAKKNYQFLKCLDKKARKIVHAFLVQYEYEREQKRRILYYNMIGANTLVNGLFKHLDKNKGVFNLTVKEIIDLKDRLELAKSNTENYTFADLKDKELNDACKSFIDYLNPLIMTLLPNELIVANSENRTSDELREEYWSYFGKYKPTDLRQGK